MNAKAGHGGQQLSGARVAGGEVHRGERAAVDAQGETVAVEDVEHVEDVPGAAYEAEHLGDVHGVARPGARQQFAELRALQRVEAAGGARGPSKTTGPRSRPRPVTPYS
ncbi:hypothetical protein [Streptomyces sp. NPDC058252]|uniref:hypothetical protein n=1 Tax=Streptomyces sp. NPDC058252 TaxID=3346405 RepID=UPI0036EB0590